MPANIFRDVGYGLQHCVIPSVFLLRFRIGQNKNLGKKTQKTKPLKFEGSFTNSGGISMGD